MAVRREYFRPIEQFLPQEVVGAEMDNIGVGVRDGFNLQALKVYGDMFRDIGVLSHKYYMEAVLEKLSLEEFSLKMIKSRETTSTFLSSLPQAFSTRR